MKKELRVLSLFSGVGAFEKGLDKSGIDYQLVNYCENEPHASSCYAAIHGESEDKNLGDVKTIDTMKLENFDLLVHGSPCQDISVNGKKKGADKGANTRSSLMWETVRIAKSKKPKYIVWENVKALVNKNNKHNLDEYIDELSKVGYKTTWQVLCAKHYGIPQNRERVFVVSVLSGDRFDFPEKVELTKTLKEMSCFREKDDITDNFVRYYKENVDQEKDFFDFFDDLRIGRTGVKNMGMYAYDQLNRVTMVDYKSDVLSPTLSCRGVQNYCIKFYSKGRIYKPSPRMCFRLMGFSHSDFDKIKDIGTDSQLWDRAGNSIVVDVASAIFDKLLK